MAIVHHVIRISVSRYDKMRRRLGCEENKEFLASNDINMAFEKCATTFVELTWEKGADFLLSNAFQKRGAHRAVIRLFLVVAFLDGFKQTKTS